MSPRSRGSPRHVGWCDDRSRYCRPVTSVRVVAPAKINLSLRVLGARADGYHDIATVFHAVSLVDEVGVCEGRPGLGRVVTTTGDRIASVPRGDDNIAARAALALARHAGLPDPDVEIEIAKSIPVAAGMAGGSADAAATLVAARALWGLSMTDDELIGLAADVGSDVPFALVGGTALGSGRGEVLAPVLATGTLHWVVALSDGELSTPHVYAEWDRLVASGRIRPSSHTMDEALLVALRQGDPAQIAGHLVNDLQPAAVSLRPALSGVIDAGRELGALAGIVSGSGPTVVFLASDKEAAVGLAAELSGTGLVRGVRHATGPVPGARIVA
jgi:4-diphosphocytidyl-2-C-methyl-D-erythritol kinase